MSRISNFLLCRKYPFLRIRGAHYSSTWYDEFLPGWRKGFGKAMLRDIRTSCISCHYLHRLEFIDVKERNGKLDITCDCPEEIMKAIERWEDFSASYCCVCGQPAVEETEGYVRHYCAGCYDRYVGESHHE